MKKLLVGSVLCFLCSALFSERVFYPVPVDVEGKMYPSNVLMSVQERKISTNGKEKYKISRNTRGMPQSDNASEGIAAAVIDAVYDKDEAMYRGLSKAMPNNDKIKVDAKLGYSVLRRALECSEHVYFVNEYQLLGLKLYETLIVPTDEAKSQGLVTEDNNRFFVAISETKSNIEHRFEALFEPAIQNLINACQCARKKESNEIKEDLHDLVKISYSANFDDSVSTPAGIDYYFKVIVPNGKPLFFEDGNLVKEDFASEVSDLWSFYAEMWYELAHVPENDEFRSSVEYREFLDNFSQGSAAQVDKSLEKANGRQFGGYKKMNLRYREVLFAVDAGSVYFVFYITRPNSEFLWHDTILRSGQVYEKVNYGYLSDMERLFDSENFEQELVKMFRKLK